ncbi:MAG: V-type ATP synthase subunit I [bacterium]
MAIASLKKIHVIGHRQFEEAVVKKLYELEVMHISDIRGELAEEELGLVFSETPAVELPGEQLGKLQYVIKFLDKYVPRDGFLYALTRGRVVVSRDEFSDILDTFDVDKVYSEVRALEEHVHRLRKREEKLKGWLREIEPWTGMDVWLSDIYATKHVSVIAGSLRHARLEAFEKEVLEVSPGIHVDKASSDGRTIFLLIFTLKSVAEEIMPTLKKYEFTPVNIPRLHDNQKSIKIRIKQKLEQIKRKQEELEKTSKALTPYYVKTLALYDHYEALKSKREAVNNLLRTQDAFFVSGWVLSSQTGLVQDALSRVFKATDIIINDPAEGEKVPIILKNTKAVRPFEVVTDLYGHPRYYELDPTPYLAPFFFIFWGMCITDAGYGLVMMLLSYLMMKKFKLEGMGKKLLKMIFLGGLSSVLWGAVVGGWFGINLDTLPGALSGLKMIRVFDPLQSPLLFFVMALVLGFIQILSGIAIKMYENLRSGHIKDAFLDEFSWLVLLLGVLVISLGAAGLVSKVISNVFTILGSVSVIVIILFKGRSSKNFFVRIFTGIFSLLGLFGFSGALSYVSDIISYARLFALGLATGALALAVNALAEVSFSVNFWFGLIVAPLVIVIGHMLNMIVNAFGGFIHSCRLQYVEFFTKFFEGGGKAFRPFREQRKYTVIK